MKPSEAISYFREADSIERIFTLLKNERLSLVVLCWENLEVLFEPPKYLKNGRDLTDASLWKLLWTHSKYDIDDLAIASGFSPYTCQPILDQAIALRLVFPDGTVAPSVRRALGIEVANMVRKMTRKK